MRPVVSSHRHVWRPAPGFTMVELIVVMIIVAILGGVAAGRYFDRRSFDAQAFADIAKTMFRYAQKSAIAQNRNVFVRVTANSISLCFNNVFPCADGMQVQVPAGTNSGTDATRAACVSPGYRPSWYCEGRPATVVYAMAFDAAYGGATDHFSFDRLGRPHYANGATNFDTLTLTIRASDNSNAIPINVAPETGYVH